MKLLFESIEDAESFIEAAEHSQSDWSIGWQNDLIDSANNYIKLKKRLEELEEEVHISYNSLYLAGRIREIEELIAKGF